MGDEADDIITSLVRNKFENHFIARRNVMFERAKFNVQLRIEFGVLKDQLIRDRFVEGLRSKKISEKLQLDARLTLEKYTYYRPPIAEQKSKPRFGPCGRSKKIYRP